MNDIQDLILSLRHGESTELLQAAERAEDLLEHLSVGFVMPEGYCASAWGGRETGPCLYTADQLREAYAAGAAAQLSDEPVAWRTEAYRMGGSNFWIYNECNPSTYNSPAMSESLYTRKELP